MKQLYKTILTVEYISTDSMYLFAYWTRLVLQPSSVLLNVLSQHWP